MKLSGKVAIITGGASGIGEASSRLFAEEGANIVIADINEDETEKLVMELKEKGYNVIGAKCDVSNEFEVQALIEKTITSFGKIDIMFNNAGIILPKTLEDISVGEWDNLFSINVKSMYLTIKHAISYLKNTKGSIINMASMTGVIGQRKNAAYSATKGAIIAMTKAAAIDYAPYGVRVNAICPAGVDTPLLNKWFSQQKDPKKAKIDSDRSHMLGYTASTLEIARVALFLASDDSSFITGEDVHVEGGATLGYAAGPKPEWDYIEQVD
jgi:NAD(P)-dependent dehydrogenase (short-subunit alcohol dehydrogenase family)